MLHLNDLHYDIGGRRLLDGATAHIPAGHKVGLVGRNGAGKSTLLRLVAGEMDADGGALSVRPGARVVLVAQEAPSGDRAPIETVLAADFERSALLAEAETARAPERIAEIHTRLADIDAHGAPARAARILAGLGFSPTDQDRPLDSFSGGLRMRVALAAALFSEPDLLLLDEPSNHLDLEATLWLEEFLKRYPRTMVLVSHERDLLNHAADHILHLEAGKLRLYSGGYDRFERTRRENLALQDKLRAKQNDQRRHMERFITRFRYKASKARQAQSRIKALERMEPIAAVVENRTVEIHLPEPQPLAPPILAAEAAAVGYEGRAVLNGIDLRLDMDDRVALLGANGNGKSTLAKLLAGRLAPLAGKLKRAPRLAVGYFAQHQLDELESAWTPYRHLAALMPDATEANARARLGAFGFAQAKADVAVADLSGGEKARLVLGLMSHAAPQALILDEPTNHLDVDAREALVHALNEYSGAVVLISHDSHLIELVAERLWLVEGGTVTPFEGDLADYRRQVLSGRATERGIATEARAAGSSRKEARRAAAEDRARSAPLRRRAAEAEAELERLNRERAEIESRLADPALYNRPAETATELGKRRAELDRAIARAEARWLAAQEALEAAGEG
jgi:ATP-binding cassette subfamily F protein 3